MTNTNIITRDYNGNVFHFREDGYFNMTKATKAFGKQLINFWSNVSTTEYILELAAAVDTHWNPNVFSNRLERVQAARSLLTNSFQGRAGGTWGHPKLAVFFARWLDIKFAVFCDMVIDDILNKKAELTITKPEESAVMASL
ncbi:MAG TPA: KilA-N domain-containing protein [Pseudomonas sabulinigri]|uniref:KilA-N domain-containing protein n=1 Tax=marine sediment metagenome TaxID=412755 RepID=A0A0F9UUU1_9ZZZZ|nr:KilA-N domain-containing protein [Halopseudomonas sabulinigri]HEC50771.1 KilA-N domain-containing protein [Halopseudomonas sabulinigri]